MAYSLRSKNQQLSNESENSFETTARICRICHVMERESKHTATKSCIAGKSQDEGYFKFLLQNCLFGVRSCGKSFTKDEEEDEEEMIAPCECKGTMKHVHRGCLNQWRTASSRSDSFEKCEQCFISYKFKNNWVSNVIMNRGFVFFTTGFVFGLWILASIFVVTGGFEMNDSLFTLLPLPFDRSGDGDASVSGFYIRQVRGLLDDQEYSGTMADELIWTFLKHANVIFYGLVLIAVTEFIFFTPSFLLAFNILFCLWRIQRYDFYFDRILLTGFTMIGTIRALRSVREMINLLTQRLVKLKLLEIIDREKDSRAP